jgi:hypothetical protein
MRRGSAYPAARRQPAVLDRGDGGVPYFASVLPHVVKMEPGLAEVQLPKWLFVYTVDE